MATCKDCIHHNLCDANECLKVVTDIIDDSINYVYSDNAQNRCAFFKNKENFVELPCVAMVEQFIKDGKSDRRYYAHNGKYAVVYIDKSKWQIPLIDITESFYDSGKALERIQALKARANNE